MRRAVLVSLVLFLVSMFVAAKWDKADREVFYLNKVNSEVTEVSKYDYDSIPTLEQQESADTLVRESYESAQKYGWFDYESGLNDGFELSFKGSGDGVHYVSPKNSFDDKLLDPDYPEYLMYYDTPLGKKLFGFMYFVRTPDEIGPQVGGPLTLWHYHEWSDGRCLIGGLLKSAKDENGNCIEGDLTYKSPQMLHVWFVDHPKGPFATQMSLPYDLREKFSHDEKLIQR